MFSIVVKCFSWFTKKEAREIKLLMLGLDNAGKSTIINDLKGESQEPTMPTVGFSSADLKLLNFKVKAYDVGGGPRIRRIWKDYYAEVFGVVYVVDASDRGRIAESKTVLREALSDSRLAGKPFVLFANKQDQEGALSEADIELEFELEQLAGKCKSPYKVFQCTAFLNNGKKIDGQLKKGLTWLLQTMDNDFGSLLDRVQKETEVQKEADKKERAQRFARVQKVREERERAEREAEDNAKETQSDDDDDVVFGNVLPRVTDVTKTKKKKGKKKKKGTMEDEEENVDETSENLQASKTDDTGPREVEHNTPEETIHHQSNGNLPETKKKKKKKRRTKRNQTAPAPVGEDDGDDSDTGVVLRPIAWKTPPASLNGFPGNRRMLEPLRPPLHSNLYSPSKTSTIPEEDDDEDGKQFSNRYIHTSRPRPNGEDFEVVT